MTFRTKLILLSGAVIISSAVATTWVVYRQSLEMMETQITDTLEQNACQTMQALDMFLFERFADVRVAAGDTLFATPGVPQVRRAARLAAYRNAWKTCVTVSFYDQHASCVADAAGLLVGHNIRHLSLWREVCQGSTSMSESTKDANALKMPVLYFAAPVRNADGHVSGAVVAAMPTVKLHDITGRFAENVCAAADARVDLVAGDGTLLYSNYNRRGVLRDNLRETPACRLAHTGQQRGSLRLRQDGQPDALCVFVRQSGFLDYPGNDWTLIVHVPVSAAFSPAIALRNRIAAVFLAAAVLSALAAVFFARTLSRPLMLLRDAAARVGRGDLDACVPIRTRDEVGDLASTFNEMVCNLRTVTASRDALNREIAERTRAEAALRASEERYRSIYSIAPLAFVMWDSQYRILEWNTAATRMFGWTRTEAVGKNFFDLLVSPAARGQVEAVVRSLSQGTLQSRSINENVTRDGRVLLCEWNNAIVYGPGGEITGAISLGLDITQRNQQEARIQRFLQELQRSNRDLEEFAAIASHDLQEPLRAIAGFLQLLSNRYSQSVPQKGREYLSRSIAAAHRLQRMVNDLLVYARITNRTQPFQMFDLNGVLSEVLENLSNAATRRQATVTSDPLPTLRGDRTQFVRLLQNLLNNSFTFCRQPPEIHLSAVHRGDTQIISVRDNGIGIAPEHVARVFNLFERLHRTEEYPGTGLGLAACRRIVEHHGGRIWIDSVPGEGSTVYISLPADDADPDCALSVCTEK